MFKLRTSKGRMGAGGGGRPTAVYRQEQVYNEKQGIGSLGTRGKQMKEVDMKVVPIQTIGEG